MLTVVNKILGKEKYILSNNVEGTTYLSILFYILYSCLNIGCVVLASY